MALLGLSLLFGIYFLLAYPFARKQNASDHALLSGLSGPWRLEIDGQFMSYATPHTQGKVGWPGVRAVAEGPEAVYIFAAGTYIVPKRALAGKASVAAFVTLLERFRAQARAASETEWGITETGPKQAACNDELHDWHEAGALNLSARTKASEAEARSQSLPTCGEAAEDVAASPRLPLQLEFDLTVDDIVAWNNFYAAKYTEVLPAMKAVRSRNVGPIVVFTFFGSAALTAVSIWLVLAGAFRELAYLLAVPGGIVLLLVYYVVTEPARARKNAKVTAPLSTTLVPEQA